MNLFLSCTVAFILRWWSNFTNFEPFSFSYPKSKDAQLTPIQKSQGKGTIGPAWITCLSFIPHYSMVREKESVQGHLWKLYGVTGRQSGGQKEREWVWESEWKVRLSTVSKPRCQWTVDWGHTGEIILELEKFLVRNTKMTRGKWFFFLNLTDFLVYQGQGHKEKMPEILKR